MSSPIVVFMVFRILKYLLIVSKESKIILAGETQNDILEKVSPNQCFRGNWRLRFTRSSNE